ncbi:hypothetical protein EI969_24085 [Pseudomonas sp. PB101]|nr:hypothetical protein [Pseudomonas sp. PB101]
METPPKVRIGVQLLGCSPLCRSELAPGGVPTMVVNDNASNQIPSGVVAFFASKLAPTGFQDSSIPRSPTFDRSLPPDETLG